MVAYAGLGNGVRASRYRQDLFALNVAMPLQSGGEFFMLANHTQAYPFLYIDGEMPVISMKERLIDVISMHDSIASMWTLYASLHPIYSKIT